MKRAKEEEEAKQKAEAQTPGTPPEKKDLSGVTPFSLCKGAAGTPKGRALEYDQDGSAP